MSRYEHLLKQIAFSELALTVFQNPANVELGDCFRNCSTWLCPGLERKNILCLQCYIYCQAIGRICLFGCISLCLSFNLSNVFTIKGFVYTSYFGQSQQIQFSRVFQLTTYMKKLLDSDSLRVVQLKSNTNAKSVIPV